MWITPEDEFRIKVKKYGAADHKGLLHRLVFIKSKVCTLLPDKRTAKRRLFLL